MREWWYASGGVMVALVLIALVWVLTGRSSVSTPSVSEVDRPAPDFALPTLDGDEVQLSDYQGQIVLVNFWGTWCEPCRHETPALQSAYEQLQDEGFVIIGVNLTNKEQIQGSTEADVRDFAQQYGITYPIALDIEGDVSKDYGIYPIPTSLFIDSRGNIRYMRFSELTTDEIKALFTTLKHTDTALHSRNT